MELFGNIPVVATFPDGLTQTYNYNADGTINYIEATDGVSTWRQTYGYTAGQVTSISAWVKQ